MSDTVDNSKVDSIVKEFLFNSLTEEQLKNLRDELLNPDKGELRLKPFAEIKLYHQLFGLEKTISQSV